MRIFSPEEIEYLIDLFDIEEIKLFDANIFTNNDADNSLSSFDSRDEETDKCLFMVI